MSNLKMDQSNSFPLKIPEKCPLFASASKSLTLIVPNPTGPAGNGIPPLKFFSLMKELLLNIFILWFHGIGMKVSGRAFFSASSDCVRVAYGVYVAISKFPSQT